MFNIAVQLLEDADKRAIDKRDLLQACLETMSEDQLYEMAILHGFIGEPETEKDLCFESSTQERIIDAVLARHGE